MVVIEKYRTNTGRDNQNIEQIYQTELNIDKFNPHNTSHCG
ncbi:MAG: hypothetical protein WCY96_00325 [Candidatus Cloacimonadaceae bacterium]